MKRASLLALVALAAIVAAPADAKKKDRPPDDWLAPGALVLVAESELVGAEKERLLGADVAALASSWCRSVTYRREAGVFAYYRALYLSVSWCYDGWRVTSRSYSTWPDTGGLVKVTWGPSAWSSGGCVGCNYADTTARAGYAGWFYYTELNDWLQLTVRVNGSGGYTSW